MLVAAANAELPRRLLPAVSGMNGARFAPWLLRAAALAALVTPAVMLATVVTLGLRRAGFAFLSQPVSDLGKRGTADAAAFNALFFVAAGLLTCVLALGIWRATGPGTSAWLATTPVAVNGTLLVLSGFFSSDPASTPATVLHSRLSFPLFFVVPAEPLAVGLALSLPGVRRCSPRYRRFCLLMAAAMVLLTALFVAWPSSIGGQLAVRWPQPSSVIGGFQRLSFLAQAVWYGGTAAWLLALARPRGEGPGGDGSFDPRAASSPQVRCVQR